MVDNKLLYAVLRTNPHDFRANIAAGAVAKLITLNAAQRKLAQNAAAACELTLCGVDITTDEHRPQIIEVNTNLGFSEKSKAITGTDTGQVMANYFNRYKPVWLMMRFLGHNWYVGECVGSAQRPLSQSAGE